MLLTPPLLLLLLLEEPAAAPAAAPWLSARCATTCRRADAPMGRGFIPEAT